MDKLIKKIVIGIVFLFLPIAIYIALSVIPGQIEQKNNEEIKAEVGDIVVMSTSANYVKSIAIANGKEFYTLEKNNENIWGIKEYPNLNFETSSIESAVSIFSSIYALEELESQADISETGLDKPKLKIKITLIDGETREFALGNKVSKGNGQYFLDVTNNKSYIISEYVGESMIKDVSDYRKLKILSLNSRDLLRFAFTNKHGKVVMELKKSAYSSSMVMKMTYPKNMAVDDNIASPIFDNIKDINVIRYVEDSPKDLSKYGIGSSSLIIEMKTAEGEYIIRYGDKTDDGIYAVVDGMNFVFVCGTNLYNVCENVTPYNLMSKFINMANINDVKSITVDSRGGKHTLEIVGSNEFEVDGKTTKADSFRKAYQDIIGLKGSGLAEKNIQSPAECVVEFEYRTGEKTTIIYASYDDINYYVEVDGERGFITPKSGVENMIKSVEALV